jgi:hypothetical protein
MPTSKPQRVARSIHDEKAGLAVLRPAWSQPQQEIGVRWSKPAMEIDLQSKRGKLWTGVWEWNASLDGEALVARSGWEEVCWESDADIAYLELQQRLSAGFRLQRQIVLARKERFVLLADAVFGRRHGQLVYQSRLPLGDGVGLKWAKASREGFLTTGRCEALVLPLALPEWRAEQGVGELVEADHALTWSYAGEGRALYAPLFFDLNPRRMTMPCTWRQLTVAESRSNVSRDVAAGFRVMIGRRQWLVYRSLGRNANRTLLGHNLSSETLVGRFLSTGLVEPLVEIE